jgi:hypothetical protein
MRSDCSVVKWGGIQSVLEECQSDVLLLLDCCHSGTSNTDEGNGITELISACDYRTIANGVGSISFTNALVTELLDSAKKPHFSVLELYNNLYFRIQGRMPEDRRERHPAPVHLVLTNNDRYWQSIRLSKQPATSHPALLILDPQDSVYTPDNSTSVNNVPCLALAISLTDDITKTDFPTKLFADWLHSMPVLAQRVRIEAGIGNFSPQLLQLPRSPLSRHQASSSKIPTSTSRFTPQSLQSVPSSKIFERYPATIASDPSVCSSLSTAEMDSPSLAATLGQSPQAFDPRLMPPLRDAKHPLYGLKLSKPRQYTLKLPPIIKTTEDITIFDLEESGYSTNNLFRKNEIFKIMTIFALFLVPPWIVIWLLSRSIAPRGASTSTVVGTLLISTFVITRLLSLFPGGKRHIIFLAMARYVLIKPHSGTCEAKASFKVML